MARFFGKVSSPWRSAHSGSKSLRISLSFIFLQRIPAFIPFLLRGGYSEEGMPAGCVTQKNRIPSKKSRSHVVFLGSAGFEAQW